VSVSCLEMNGASGPNITHTVKPVSKYRKHANSAFQFPDFNDSITFLIRTLPSPLGQKKTAEQHAR
jgi:hypothetical protein